MAGPKGTKQQSKGRRPGRKKSRLGLWTAVLLALLIAVYLGVLELNRPHVTGDRLRYDLFVKDIDDGRIKRATILDQDSYAVGLYQRPDGVIAPFNTPLTSGLQSSTLLQLTGADVPTTVDQQVSKRIGSLAATLLPGLILIVLFSYLILSYRRGTGLFGIRSGARKVKPDDAKVSFADVAGQSEAVAELLEIRDFLISPNKYFTVGAEVPKGVLLYGPPGCGKTMLAKALAGESHAAFYSISGSDFVELYVGVGASRVRELFAEARANSPAIIFIDELDSVGRARSNILVNTTSEHEQSLNQILAEMDGFSTEDGIVVLGATNRPDVLDPALLRPGRFDRTIALENPSEEARLAILAVHSRNRAISPTVDLGTIADKAHGMTGADLANIMNESALLAARAGREQIVQSDLQEALKRVQEAPERQRRMSLRGRSIGRRFGRDERISFSAVGGQESAVAELREIKDYLLDPERFTSLGVTVPRGVLLYGPPGCGKTLLAKALASEAEAAFISVAASEFVESFLGGGAKRVREMFAEARATTPAILFIDELDGIGRSRAGASGVGGEQEQTLNQILAEMDGFSTTTGVIVVAATNRPDVLDSALLRPGRFDRTIGLDLPNEKGRLAILHVHAEGKALGRDVDLAALATKAFGLTGADLANIVNEAGLLAGREEREAISQADLEEALKRTMAAPERQRRLSMRSRSVGHRYVPDDKITFANVAGADDALAELAEVKEYLADPGRFADMGARVPRGILLFGPPGTGKTLLARAIAGEANAGFLWAGATDFVEIFVGQGPARVRDLFADARAMAPAIVFIDEIDAVGGHRSNNPWKGDGGERESTLNQLLIELDGFDKRDAVIVIGATNRPDMLDSALVRAGRFDRQIAIRLPDRSGRRAILDLYTREKALADDVDLDVVARTTAGMSGADLENVVNEAALLAARDRHDRITMTMLDEGIDRTALGVGSRSTLMSDEEKRIVAIHEAGHAVVALGLEHATAPHKVTIMPRASTLGHCAVVDDHEHDRVLYSRARLLDRMAVSLGGWTAEQLVFRDVSSGAGTDLERVSTLARSMVRNYGMSEALGPMVFPQHESRYGPQAQYSEEATGRIDAEVQRLVTEAHDRAKRVLGARRDVLERVAGALLEKETIDADDLGRLAGTVKEVRSGRRGSSSAPRQRTAQPRRAAGGDNAATGGPSAGGGVDAPENGGGRFTILS